MGTFHGFYRGLVLSNADPEKRGRLILQVPQVLGMRPTTWALPCWPAGWNRSLMHDHVFIDNDTGDNAAGSKTETLRHKLLIAVPGAGATVWVTFENGDPGSPVWVGMGTNTQIADALLGTDRDAGAGESGDGTPIGDGTQEPSAYSVPPLSTSTSPTHEHVYPVDSVNGKTGTVSLSIADVPGLMPWSRIEAAPATATRWPSWAEVTAKPTNFATTDGAQTFTAVNTFSLAPVVPDGSWTIAKTTGLQTELDSKASTASLSGYLTTTGKAADSELLDGLDSTAFLRKGETGSGGGHNTKSLDVGTLNQRLPSGWYDGSSVTGAPSAAWWLVQVIAHSNGAHWQRQIAYSMTDGTRRIFSRQCNGGDPTLAASWTGWEAVKEDTGWQALNYQNSWTDYGGVHAARIRKVNGVVYIKGLITAPAGVNTGEHIAFLLPVGFRCAGGGHLLLNNSGGGGKRMDIRPTDGGYLPDGFTITGASASTWHSVEATYIADA